MKDRGFIRELQGRGYLRRTSDGQFVLDTCPTDAEHLMAPPADPEEAFPRRRCRVTFDMLFDEEFLGRKGELEIVVKFTADEVE